MSKATQSWLSKTCSGRAAKLLGHQGNPAKSQRELGGSSGAKEGSLATPRDQI